jgi:hypothetical protein
MTFAHVFKWWELRRVPYNAALVFIGVAAIAGMEWLMGQVIPLGEDAVEPMALMLGILLYGFAANVCYTLGWIIELHGRRRDPTLARERARWMFRAGMLFSALLTTTPFWFGCAFWLSHRSSHR